MSIINRMLQELDGRNALRADPQTQTLAAKVRPINRGGRWGSEAFWRMFGFVMVLMVGWVGWVIWQLMPRPVVTPLALASVDKPRPPAVQTVAPAPAPEPPVVAAPPRAAGETGVRVDSLKLAMELTAPATSAPAPKETRIAAPVPQSVPQSARPVPVPPRPPAAETRSAGESAAQSQRSAVGSIQQTPDARIDKRVAQAPRERAEREYQRGLGLVNQGRVAEGIEALQGALSADAAHQSARQALVTLLVEGRRYDDAVRAMNEGMALNPADVALGMRLARVHVERGDAGTALSVLESLAPAGMQNADYHAFRAALYQRTARHREAVEEYEAALKLLPANGAWWVGRGISLQALQRSKEALEAFRRAKSAGNLTPDLIAFADQRIKQLQ